MPFERGDVPSTPCLTMNAFFFLRQMFDDDYDLQIRGVQTASGNGSQQQMTALFLIIFDMTAAALLMAVVFYDVWRLRNKTIKLQVDGIKPPNIFQCIQPGEVVTLSFATSVLAQGVLFLIVQYMDIQSPISQSCREVSQIVFPAMWLVGLVVLVFGFETLYRAFQRKRFASRGRWNICVCYTAILVLLVLLWIPTRVRQPKADTCPSALLYFSMPWADIAFGVTIGLVVSDILIALFLTAQLLRTPMVNRSERIAASQMVYYLGITAISFVLMLPLWARIAFNESSGVTFMLAMVSLNVLGMAVWLFQLVFRPYAESMSIRPPRSWQNSPGRNFLGFRTFNIKNHISSPGAVDEELVSSILTNPIEFNAYDNERSPIISNTNNVTTTPTSNIKAPGDITPALKRTRYSPFPTNPSTSRLQNPYSSIDDDPPPVPPLPPFAQDYRDSTDTNHATVQIGLRLSNHVLTSGIRSSSSGPALPLSPLAIPPVPHFGEAIGHLSATSLEVPVTLRSPATENINQNGFPYPVKPLRLKSNALTSDARGGPPEQSSPVMNFSRLPSSVYHESHQSRKTGVDVIGGVDVNSESSPASSDSPWPMRDSLPILLSSKAYDPQKDNWI